MKVRDHWTGCVILADSPQGLFPESWTFSIEERYKGSDLVGRRFLPLFPYFAERKNVGAFQKFAADYVTTEDGTGIVTSPQLFEDFALPESWHRYGQSG